MTRAPAAGQASTRKSAASRKAPSPSSNTRARFSLADLQPESAFLTVNGLRLHHLDWGNKDAPPFVFVHGLGGNAHAFDGVARRYSVRSPIVSIGVRGRGGSEWSKVGVEQMSEYASGGSGTVDALGFQKFHPAGMSM